MKVIMPKTKIHFQNVTHSGCKLKKGYNTVIYSSLRNMSVTSKQRQSVLVGAYVIQKCTQRQGFSLAV